MKLKIKDILLYYDVSDPNDYEIPLAEILEKIKNENLSDIQLLLSARSGGYETDVYLQLVKVREETDEEYNKRIKQEKARLKNYNKTKKQLNEDKIKAAKKLLESKGYEIKKTQSS